MRDCWKTWALHHILGRAINVPKGAHEETGTIVQGCTNKLNSISFNFISSAVKRRWYNYPSMQLPEQIIHSPFHSAHCCQHLCDLKRFLYPAYKDEQPGCVTDITGLFQAKGGKSKLAAVFQIFFNVVNLFYYGSLGKGAFSNVSLSQGILVQKTPPKTLHQRMVWLLCHWMCKAWSNVPLLLLQLF